MRIGIDLMGSDNSPINLFDAVLQAAHQLDPSTTLVVIATHSVVNELKLSHYSSLFLTNTGRIEFFPVGDSITMQDEPLYAISHKKSSSLVMGIRLLKKKRLDAFVTAGNTGALIASATLQLPKLPGIKRPALLVVLPTVTGSVAVLDVGGSVSCKPQHLVQFAYLGAAYQSCCENIPIPKVALLNIGVEPKKGTSTTQQAYQTLKEQSPPYGLHMQFQGNVEGRDVFKGGVDVLVTDGFTGNVLLKTSEGISSFIFDYIQETLRSNIPSELHHNFRDLKSYFAYDEYPGAIVCGVEGLVIKCHGQSSVKAMLNSIKGAIHLINQNVISCMKTKLL